MIQRIQTVYLLLASIAYSLLFYFPINEMLFGNRVLVLNIWGLYEQNGDNLEQIAEAYPILILSILSVILPFLIIFLFKNRKLQMRLTLNASIISLGLMGLNLYYLYQVATTNETQIGFSVGLVLPLVAFILQILAFRAIRKDDLLIKSIDRIR